MRPVLTCCAALMLAAWGHPQDTVGSLAVDIAKLPGPTEEQTLALQTLNGFRALHGLEPVTMDSRLNAAALGHVAEMTQTNVLSHKGKEGKSETATKRAKNFGYSNLVSELVAMGMPTSPYAVVTFIDAPYHRRLLLKPGRFDFGCATDQGFSCFVLGGQPEKRIVVSPPANSEGVPCEWDGREEPDPMRGTGLSAPFGYPILISAFGHTDKPVVESMRLTDASGSAVDCVVREPKNDSESRDSIIVIPKRPLKARTVYTIKVDFTLGANTRSETWSFTTGDRD